MTPEVGTIAIDGTFAPGFEPVRDAFAAGADDLGRGGGAFCAYVGDEKIVDLWGGWASPGAPWAGDTLVVLASATKAMATLCAQALFSRGQLDIEAPVASYWPEFAANGKERITVRQVLDHTAGLIGLPGHEEFMRWDGTGWDDYERLARCLAASEPAWEPGTKVGYHPFTYGWLIGEIVRRITGRSIGTVFADEIAGPLGLDAYIGTPPSEVGRVAAVIRQDPDDLPEALRDMVGAMQDATRDPETLHGRAVLSTSDTNFLDAPQRTPEEQARFLTFEAPASNGTSSARSLAKMYALLAAGGELDGTRLVSSDSIEVFRTVLDGVPQAGVSPMMEVSRALGYQGNFTTPFTPAVFGPNPMAFGHVGGGGQIGCCDPENEVAIGFVRSHKANLSTFSMELIHALYDNLP